MRTSEASFSPGWDADFEPFDYPIEVAQPVEPIELMALGQAEGESFADFAARIRMEAEISGRVD